MIQMLSVIIPAYNEGHRIDPMLNLTHHFLNQQPFASEIIVVDDGSQDDTARKVELCAQTIRNLRLIRHPRNLGKGTAVRTGLLASRGDGVLFCDADGATPMTELKKFLPHLDKGVELVVGSRRQPGSQIVRKQPAFRQWMGKVYTVLCRWWLIPGIQDVTCGFKLLSSDAAQKVAQRMRIPGWSFDAEIFAIAQLHGLTVVQVPIQWADQGQSKVRPFRNAWTSFVELLLILKYRAQGVYR